MKKLDTRKLVMILVMFVITLLLSWLPAITYPMQGTQPGGYWNLGDVGLYLSAALLGGPWGAIIAALGAAIADLIRAQAIYAPATLVIKALMALLFAWYIKQGSTVLHLIKGVGYCGGLMTLLYFLYDLILRGNYQIAAIGLPLNLLQVIASGIITAPLLFLLGGRDYREGNGFRLFREGTPGGEPPRQTGGRNLK